LNHINCKNLPQFCGRFDRITGDHNGLS
jgi:hypothetical protein